MLGVALLFCLGAGYKTLLHSQNVPVAQVSTSTEATATTSNTSSLKTAVSVAKTSDTASSSGVTGTATVTVPAGYQTASLIVGSTQYRLSFPLNSTVEAAMKLLEQQNPSFTFTEQNYPGLGEFVNSINGKQNVSGNYWFLYVNGIDSPTGISETTLHSGDSIEWRYEHQ